MASIYRSARRTDATHNHHDGPDHGALGHSTTVPARGPFLQVGDQIRVSRRARLTITYDGNRYRIAHGSVTLKCDSVRIGTTASRRQPAFSRSISNQGK